MNGSADRQVMAASWHVLLVLGCAVFCIASAYWLTMTALHPSFNGSAGVPYTAMRHIKMAVWGVGLAVAFMAVLIVLRRQRWAALAYALALLIFWFVLWPSLTMYFAYFGDLPHLLQYQNIQYADQLGSQIGEQLLQPVQYAIAALLTLALFAAILFLRWQRSFQGWARRLFWLFAIGALALNTAIHLIQSKRVDVSEGRFGYFNLIEQHGLTWTYWTMLQQVINRPAIGAAVFPGKLNPVTASKQTSKPLLGETSGLPNIIVIQVESLDASLLELDVGEGQGSRAVTPFLRQLAAESIHFTHFYAQHSGGGSSDAELAVLTGLLPLREEQGLGARNIENLPALPKLLVAKGYTTAAMHANSMGFFHRHEAYPRLGFQQLFDQNDYQGDAAGWQSKDKPFFQQSVVKLKALKQPFFSYMITMQSHGPFQNYHPATDEKLGLAASMPKNRRDYLATMHEVDVALAAFFKELEAARLRQNSLVFLFGDHSSHVLDGKSAVEHIPLIINYPGVVAEKISAAATPLSLGNTILAAIGEPSAKFGFGDNLLNRQSGRRTLFNDLNEARVINGKLQLQQNAELLPFIEYSQTVLQ